MERKCWLDNIRWAAVLLVLLYHVFYMFNAEGVMGGMDHFAEVQYQDAVLYLLYPWIMPLLFVVAGVSSRYALQCRTRRAFIKSRTYKLLIPSTLGLFVFQWIVGCFNATGAVEMEGIPLLVRYLIYALSGTGPLWFVQDLWLFSLIAALWASIDLSGRMGKRCGRLSCCLLLAVSFALLLAMAQLYAEVSQGAFAGLVNLYRPHYYFVAFGVGYFVFSREEVQELIAAWGNMFAGIAVVGLVVYAVCYLGQDYTSPEHLALPVVQALAFLSVLGVFGTAKHYFNKRGKWAAYFTRSSFGIYVVHYAVLIASAWLLTCGFRFDSLSLPPVVIYLGCCVLVFVGSPLLYELLSRIPILRFCIFGIKK